MCVIAECQLVPGIQKRDISSQVTNTRRGVRVLVTCFRARLRGRERKILKYHQIPPTSPLPPAPAPRPSPGSRSQNKAEGTRKAQGRSFPVSGLNSGFESAQGRSFPGSIPGSNPDSGLGGHFRNSVRPDLRWSLAVQDKQQAQLRIVDVAQLRIVKKGPLDPLLKAVFSDQKKVT